VEQAARAEGRLARQGGPRLCPRPASAQLSIGLARSFALRGRGLSLFYLCLVLPFVPSRQLFASSRFVEHLHWPMRNFKLGSFKAVPLE